jgi:hypothetical protein
MDAGPSHSRSMLFACLLLGRFYSPSGMAIGHVLTAQAPLR